MSTKLGVLLSLTIFFQSFLMIFDIMNVQRENTRLTLESNYVNQLIIKNKGISLEVRVYVNTVMKGKIFVEGKVPTTAGERLTYTIVIEVQRIYSGSIQEMSITRSVLFGYTLG